MSFSSDIEKIAKKLNQSIESTVRATALELFGSIIVGTPVLTGRAKGNWQTSINEPITSVIDRAGDTEAIAELKNVAGGSIAGKILWLSNNLPYIRRLEFDGHSSQAPAGMVRINVARIKSIVSNAAKDNKL